MCVSYWIGPGSRSLFESVFFHLVSNEHYPLDSTALQQMFGMMHIWFVHAGGRLQDIFTPSGPTFQIARNQEGRLVQNYTVRDTTCPQRVLAFCFKAPRGNNAFVLMCGLQRKGGKSLGSGIVSVSSCCMSDKLKGYRYEHGKILGKQGVKTKQQMSLSTQKCAVMSKNKGKSKRTTFICHRSTSWGKVNNLPVKEIHRCCRQRYTLQTFSYAMWGWLQPVIKLL